MKKFLTFLAAIAIVLAGAHAAFASIFTVPQGGTGFNSAQTNGVVYNTTAANGPLGTDSNFTWDPSTKNFFVGDASGSAFSFTQSAGGSTGIYGAQLTYHAGGNVVPIFAGSAGGAYAILGDNLSAANGTRLIVSDSDQSIRFDYLGNGYTFPIGHGTAGQTFVDDGSGNLSWASGGASSTGPATQVRYFDNSGNDHSDSGFTRDSSTFRTDIDTIGNSFIVHGTQGPLVQSGTSFSGSGPDDLTPSASPFTGVSGTTFTASITSVNNESIEYNNLVGGSFQVGDTITVTSGPGTGITGTVSEIVGVDTDFILTNLTGQIGSGDSFDNGAGVSANWINGGALYDRFFWNSSDGGSATRDVDTSPVSLTDNVTVTFGALTGHIIGDQWDWNYTSAFGGMLALDGYNKTYGIGDLDSVNNGTQININDASQTISSLGQNFGFSLTGGSSASLSSVFSDGGNNTYLQVNPTNFYVNGGHGPFIGFDTVNYFAGFGTNTPSATVDVEGTFKLADGTQAAGYVLTSDVDGNATWQAAGGGGSALIGQTSGLISAPTPGATFEAWYGQLAGGNGASDVATTFIGYGAGNTATGAYQATFVGEGAGGFATDAFGGTFYGAAAGLFASNAFNTTAMGLMAGQNATNASESIFFGGNAGNGATDANQATFIGASAGTNAATARHSIFIGFEAGMNDTVNNTASGTSIIIGDAGSTGGYQNSVGIGAGVLNTTSNQFLVDAPSSPFTNITLNSSTGLFQAGDIGSVGNSTLLSVNDVSQTVFTQSNTYSMYDPTGSEVGFQIDFPSGIYAFGATNGFGNQTFVKVDDGGEVIDAQSVYKVRLGDVSGANHSTDLQINDGSQTIQARLDGQFGVNSVAGHPWFQADTSAKYVRMGDIDGINNSILLTVDDAGQSIIANTVGGLFKAGDINLTANNTQLLLDDGNKTVVAYVGNDFRVNSPGNEGYFKADVANRIISMGDLSNAHNRVKFSVDDGAATNTSEAGLFLAQSTIPQGSHPSISANSNFRQVVIGDVDLSANQSFFSVDDLNKDMRAVINSSGAFTIQVQGGVQFFQINALAQTIKTNGGHIDSTVKSVNYGTTTALTSVDYDLEVGASGSGATTVTLPTGTNAPIGTTYIVKDFGVTAVTNNITIDAGTSNTIKGTTSAQTYVMAVNGSATTVKKVTASAWSVQ